MAHEFDLTKNPLASKEWPDLPAESGQSQAWANLPTPMKMEVKAPTSSLLVLAEIGRSQQTQNEVNTAYRILVDGNPVGLTNTGGTFSWDYVAVSFHGVAMVEGDCEIDIEVQYLVTGGEVTWLNNSDGVPYRRLTVAMFRPRWPAL